MEMKRKMIVKTSFGPVVCEIIGQGNISMEELESEVKEIFDKIPDVTEVTPVQKEKDIDYYITKIAEKNRMSFNKMDNFLYKMYEINPTAVIQTILREIAIDMDAKYEGHINKCKYVYCLSLTNGKVFKVGSKTCKNFRNFAAFRTEEDAKEARRILGNDWKILFKGHGKQENKECNCNNK